MLAPHFFLPRAHPSHCLFTFLQSPCHSHSVHPAQLPALSATVLRLHVQPKPSVVGTALPAKTANPMHMPTTLPGSGISEAWAPRSHTRPFLAALPLPHLTFLRDLRVVSVQVM